MPTVQGVIAEQGRNLSVQRSGPYTDTTSGTAKRTFSDVPIGNPSSDREIWVFFGYQASADTAMTVTIGGNAMTRRSWVNRSSANVQVYSYSNYSASDIIEDLEVTPAVTVNGMVALVYIVKRRSAQLTNFGDFGFYPDTSGSVDFENGGTVFGAVCSLNATGTGELGMDIFDIVDADEFLDSNNDLAFVVGRKYPTTTASSQAVNVNTTFGTGYGWVIRSIGHDG